jgi:hypothetical protein
MNEAILLQYKIKIELLISLADYLNAIGKSYNQLIVLSRQDMHRTNIAYSGSMFITHVPFSIGSIPKLGWILS